jgi:putative membrane protein
MPSVAEPPAAGLEPFAVFGLLAGLAALTGYLGLALAGRDHGWPVGRIVFWVTGTVAAMTGVVGPLARAADDSFPAHIGTHLLLGMLAPVLLTLAAPVTLAFRALPARLGRRLSHLLKTPFVRFVTEPVVAGTLNVGGLWLLYTTPLYDLAHRYPVVHVAVHVHMFVAGYLFAVAIIGVDPAPHRRSFRHRTLVLVAAWAAHDILAKLIYAHPPRGVPSGQAELGAMIMYYGGDAVELVVLIILGSGWYRGSRPRVRESRPSPDDAPPILL